MIRAFVTILVTFIASLVQAMPDIKTFTTPAGTPTWLVEDHNIPFVALELRFIGGTAMEPVEKRGVTQFMMGCGEPLRNFIRSNRGISFGVVGVFFW